MPMIRIMPTLALIMLAGCAVGSSPYTGTGGPTGRISDSGNISPLTVRDVWKLDLETRSKKLVTSQISFGNTARFDNNVRYDGYYDSARNVTTIGVYGNVTTSTDYGEDRNNGYYVNWDQTGQVTADFPTAPWRLVDVEITDQQY